MAAPQGNLNGIGNSGGKSLQDRKLAAHVRSLTLTKIKDLFEMPTVKMNTDDYELYKAILIKLSGTVLPRLNEVTGADGKDLLPTPILANALPNDDGNSADSEPQGTNQGDSGRDISKQNDLDTPDSDKSIPERPEAEAN